MKIKPFKNYSRPDYPDLFSTVAKPDLLKKHVPLSWRYKSIVLGALMAFVMAGCSPKVQPGKNTEISQSETEEINHKPEKDQEKPNFDSIAGFVAPVFVHGVGAASIGCMAIASPVFTGEQDAKRIIEDELSKAGVKFPSESSETVKINLKKIYINEFGSNPNFTPPPEEKREGLTIELDNYNQKTNFGYEYISAGQSRDVIKSNVIHSSVIGFDTLEIAQKLNKSIKKKIKGNQIVLFYDPLPNHKGNIGLYELAPNFILPDDVKDGLRETSRDQYAEKLLRAQVKDFIKWAKKEGVLDKIKS